MQNAVPKGQGGMVAVLGSTVDVIEKILTENKENFKAQIANDNSEGQIVLSGKTEDLENLIQILKDNSIKNIKTNEELNELLCNLFLLMFAEPSRYHYQLDNQYEGYQNDQSVLELQQIGISFFEDLSKVSKAA